MSDAPYIPGTVFIVGKAINNPLLNPNPVRIGLETVASFSVYLYEFDGDTFARPATAVAGQHFTVFAGPNSTITSLASPGFTAEIAADKHSATLTKLGGNDDQVFQIQMTVRFAQPGDERITVNGLVIFETEGRPNATSTYVANVIVNSASLAADELWWLGGENPVVGDMRSRQFLQFLGGAAGLFKWEIVRGQGCVQFRNGNQLVTTLTLNMPIVMMQSIGASREGEVQVRLTHTAPGGAPTEYDYFCSVYEPARAVPGIPSDFPQPEQGIWTTSYGIQIYDQFSRPFTGVVDVNEVFGPQKKDAPIVNWKPPAQKSGVTNNGKIEDTITCPGPQERPVPPPVLGTHSDAHERVDHFEQTFFVGSQIAGRGVQVFPHILQFYRGRARYITPDAPQL